MPGRRKMSRRGFLKWFAVLIGAIALMLTLLVQLLRKAATEMQNRTADGAAPPAPQTTASASGAESAAPAVPLLSFFVLTDPHISPHLPQHTKRMKQALADIEEFREQAEAIVITGDVADFGRDSDYKLFQQIVSDYKLPPVLANMGNHDYYHIWLDKNGQFNRETMPNGKSDVQSWQRFARFMGKEKPYYDQWIKGYHFILLSQEAYVQQRPEVGEGAWHSDEQLHWLRETLAPHRDGSPAFVMIHQPLPAIGQDGGSHRFIRASEFREILKPYPNVFVFSGHTHREFTANSYVKETFHWFQNSSVTRVRSPRKADNEFSQGFYVQVYADQVVLRGREFSDRTWFESAHWTVPLAKV